MIKKIKRSSLLLYEPIMECCTNIDVHPGPSSDESHKTHQLIHSNAPYWYTSPLKNYVWISYKMGGLWNGCWQFNIRISLYTTSFSYIWIQVLFLCNVSPSPTGMDQLWQSSLYSGLLNLLIFFMKMSSSSFSEIPSYFTTCMKFWWIYIFSAEVTTEYSVKPSNI